MRPLLDATFAGQSEHSIRFDLESGWRCQLFALADDLIRVLFLHNDAFREPRSWMVAPGGIDVPWEGRDRRDLTGFACPPFSVTEGERQVTLATASLSVRVSLRPFGLRCSADGKTFASDRATYAYQWSERKPVLRHYMARTQSDRFFETANGPQGLRFSGELPGPILHMEDGWQKVRITLHAPGTDNFWIAPIETVSESEEGFERVYQGSQILARWRLSTQKVLSARIVWRIEAI